jgi:hypothetical protein
MKKSSIIKTCVAIIVIVTISILVVLLRFKPAPTPIPTFNFLSGRSPIAQIGSVQIHLKETCYYYSFEADFGDVIADANSEFSGLDYDTHYGIYNPSSNDPERTYYLHQKNPKIQVIVRVLKNLKWEAPPPLNVSGHFMPNPPEPVLRNGWVTVEVIQREKENKFIVWLKRIGMKLRVLK